MSSSTSSSSVAAAASSGATARASSRATARASSGATAWANSSAIAPAISSAAGLATPGVGRYLRCFAAVAGTIFLLLWAFVALLPTAVLDEEYPVWSAKQDMIKACDLGSTIVLGDSRAVAGIIPALLPMRTTNLAFGGGTPVETYYAARHALRCPDKPARAIVSISMFKFVEEDIIWERTMRFGFLSAAELHAVEAEADALRDPALRLAANLNHVPAAALGWLYLARFPPLYFNSLMCGCPRYRYRENRRIEAAVLRTRGYSTFPPPITPDRIGVEALFDAFTPSPLLDHYFDKLIALLVSHGIQVDLVAAPINRSTFDRISPAVRQQFDRYFRSYAARYPGVRLVGTTLPRWPDRYFSDVYQHMTPAGATLFSRWLGACLLGDGCDEATLDQWPTRGRVVGRNASGGPAVPE